MLPQKRDELLRALFDQEHEFVAHQFIRLGAKMDRLNGGLQQEIRDRMELARNHEGMMGKMREETARIDTRVTHTNIWHGAATLIGTIIGAIFGGPVSRSP